MYDIRNVGYEYMMAERCRKEGDIENALRHYHATINNYYNADNENMLPHDSPYTITERDKTISFPSVRQMVKELHKRVKELNTWNI